MGIIFIVVTLSVLFFKKENSEILNDSPCSNISIKEAYIELFNYINQPYVLKISLIILSLKFCYAATDSLINPKLIEFGLQKKDFALLSIPSIIIQMAVSIIANNMTKGCNPVHLYMKVFPFKLLLVVFSMVFIHFVQIYRYNRVIFLSMVFIFSIIHNVLIF
uniref:Acetyl-coenzyme A transporter 1 (Trinotate prediction) n=1 Tax=Henneguya salminicola TaxID=69463 RepID=A0A6G3MFZ2_HENSL